jgi:hypothetical protein
MRQRLRRLITSGITVLAIAAAGLGPAASAQAATTGTLVVTVTDSLGAPVVGATLSLLLDGYTTWDRWGSSPSGANGTITVHMLPHTFRMQISTPNGLNDYVPGKTTPQEAGAYSVASGETTTVAEQLSQSGNVVVSLLDKVTGGQVIDACVTLRGAGYTTPRVCDRSDGRYAFAGVPLGAGTILASDSETHWDSAAVPVTVSPGVVETTVRLDPAAAIHTSVEAADDPSAHPEFCVYPVYAANTLLYPPRTMSCSDPATGNLWIGPLPSVPVQLFAVSADYFDTSRPFAPVYGAQWVGATGGTGDQRLARTFTLNAGQVDGIAPIRVDRAGSITGSVTGPAYDTWSQIFVTPFAPQLYAPIMMGAQGLGTEVHIGTSFLLTGLGPYQWPVLFQDSAHWYAEQWSGGAPNRYQASMVSVPAGGAGYVNATMTTPGNRLYGTLLGSSTQPANYGFVIATNAITGDWTGGRYLYENNWEVDGLTPDPVRLTYVVDNQVKQYRYEVHPFDLFDSAIGLVLGATRPIDPLTGGRHITPPTRPTVTVTGAAPAQPPNPTSPVPAKPTSPVPPAPATVAPLSTCATTEPRCV